MSQAIVSQVINQVQPTMTLVFAIGTLSVMVLAFGIIWDMKE